MSDSRPEPDWEWLQGEVRSAAKDFALQLTKIQDGAVRVPNLEWSVSELAAHLISLPSVYRDQNRLPEPFEPPDDWPTFSRATRAHISETDLKALAPMIEAETEGLLSELGAEPNASRTLYGRPVTAENVAAGYLGELLLHGQDLDPLANTEVALTARQANAIVGNQMALAPAFVDPAKAMKCPGIYHLRFRGGDEYTYRIADGVLTVEPGRPAKADCRLVADPVAFVLVSLGRMSDIRAGLTGKSSVMGANLGCCSGSGR